VQARSIPHLLTGRGMMIQARTGIGKTGAFVLPMLQRVGGEFLKSRGDRCLIEPAIVLLPSIRSKVQRSLSLSRLWQLAFQARVRAMAIEITLKGSQFGLSRRIVPISLSTKG
jgi:DEAD/DEAH box helicase